MAFSMTADKVVESPRDTVVEAVIVEVSKTTWRNIIDPDKLNKFDFPDEEIVEIKYETKYKENHIRGSKTYKYYENPMSNSKLGKFLTKYGKLEAGVQIKVFYDDKSIPKISLPN